MRGCIDKVAFQIGRGWVVDGWAADLADPDRALDIEVLEGTDLVGAGRAADFRADLAEAAIGNGCYGFSLPLSRQEKGLAMTRTLSLRAAGSKTALMPPTLFNLQPLIGHLDAIEGLFAVGWACNLSDLATPVVVELLIDGEMIERIDANQFRHDLVDRGIGGGSYGFHCLIPRPFVDSRLHHIAARIVNTKILLGTAIAMTLRPEQLTARLRRLYYMREAAVQHTSNINEALLQEGSKVDLHGRISAKELDLGSLQSFRSAAAGNAPLSVQPKVGPHDLKCR